jgi:shikimate kinase
MNLILFGFKSCGKTTLGKILAKQMRRRFLDTDRLVEHIHYTQTGEKKTYREIFKAIGPEQFRSLESAAIEQLKNTKDAIIALGGGTILPPEHTAALAKLGQLVYLKLNKETLQQRILSRPLPAYLDPLDPQGSFERMYLERHAQYEKIPAISIDMETKTQEQVIQELHTLIEQSEAHHGK